MKKYLVLENIRSAYNVGAMFRTADGAGVTKIFLCGYTPAPTDRFGRVQEEIRKTSLGASETMEWEKVEDCKQVVDRLQSDGVQVVAVEQADGAKSLREFSAKETSSIAFIMGNEVDGVSQEVLEIVDTIVFIPMLGKKESLNVSTTAGIVLYHGIV